MRDKMPINFTALKTNNYVYYEKTEILSSQKIIMIITLEAGTRKAKLKIKVGYESKKD